MCPCGHQVSKDSEKKWFCLAQPELDRVTAMVKSVVPSKMAADEAFLMALQFEFDWLLECPVCHRLLWLHGDEVVGSLKRE